VSTPSDDQQKLDKAVALAVTIALRPMQEEINGLRLHLDRVEVMLKTAQADIRHHDVELSRKADEFHDHD
jgi:hypothetical protein